jgi:hypothetical protein
MKYNVVEYNTIGTQGIGWTIEKKQSEKEVEITVETKSELFKALKGAGFFPKGTRVDAISFYNDGKSIRIHRLKDYKPLGELVAI